MSKGVVSIRHFQKAVIIILVLNLGFGLVSTARATLVSGVPYYAQIKSYYCGPACLEMLFNFYGPDISQYEIAGAARTDIEYYGTYTDDMRRAAHFSNLSTSVGTEFPPVTGYTGRGLGFAAFEYGFSGIDGLKPLIDAGYPILVLTAGDKTKTWGHYRVVIGYDDASSIITMQDPYYGANCQINYATFDDLWQSWSGRWGLFVHPWSVATTSSPIVLQGSTFTVSSVVAYPCPPPFSTSDFPASSSNATIQLPPGLSLAPGETPTKTLGTGTMTAGGSASVQWNVTADSLGTFSITTEGEGQVSGSVAGYSYTDRIGGTSNTNVTVTSLSYDISVLSVAPVKTIVGEGYPENIDVTVSNNGIYPETFNVTVYANTTIINQTEVTVTSGDTVTVGFAWNTTDFAKGNYTISAHTWPIPGERNNLTDGIVYVGIPGDVDASGLVNMLDLYNIALNYGKTAPFASTEVANCDVDGNGMINMLDLYITALYYGQSVP